MQNCKLKVKSFKNLKVFILDGEKEITKKSTEIYSSGKSSDSPGGFKRKRTGEIN